MNRRRVLWWVLGILGGSMLVIVVLAVLATEPDPAGQATTTSTITSTAAPTVPDVLAGFDTARIELSGESWTVAVADESFLRAQGLMGVTDLGDLDGMLFVFEGDTSSGFWMKDTLIPLDIAFFTVDGDLVDLLQMEPCDEDPCPLYEPSGPYRYALEVPRGGFEGLVPLTLNVP